jgi:Peptidase M15
MITVDPSTVDWTAGVCPVSKYFVVKECLALPSWGDRLAIESDIGTTDDWQTILSQIHEFANEKMDALREWAGCAFNVHVWYRPPAYNLQIGGAKGSAHLEGIACDFNPLAGSCQDLIQRIRDEGILAQFDLRMENNGFSPSWIHIDSREPAPGKGRFFIP